MYEVCRSAVDQPTYWFIVAVCPREVSSHPVACECGREKRFRPSQLASQQPLLTVMARPDDPGGRVRSSHPSPVHTRRALRRPDGGRRGLTVTPAVWVRPYSAETAQTAQTAGAQIAAHVKTRKRSHTNLKPQDILMPPLSAHKGQGGVHWTRQQGHGVPQYIDCRQAHGPSQAPSASHHTRLYIVEFELFGSV